MRISYRLVMLKVYTEYEVTAFINIEKKVCVIDIYIGAHFAQF